MKAYRKRMKGSWNAGKACKGDKAERQYAKQEIKQLLASNEHDYMERYHKGARTKNMKARLEYRIRWFEQVLALRADRSDSFTHYLRDGAVKARAALAKFIEKEKQND